jgi:uncharacterized protein involved in exopolysaccharide biosynthesis
MNASENTPQVFQDDEIDLVELLRPIIQNWRLLVKSAIAFGFAGVIIALSIPNTFKAKTTFIPQTGSESGGSSSLSGLASLAGINLGGISSGSDIPASLYPQIVSSVPFKRELLDQKIDVGETSKTIGEHFLANQDSSSFIGTVIKYTIGLPSIILNSFRGETKSDQSQNRIIYQVSKEDRKLFEALEKKLVLSPNKKEGFVTLEFSDQNKFVAAQIVERAKELLQSRIIEFKNQSARELLIYTTRQYDENRKAYERLQDSLAIFKDQNLNISSSLYQNRLDRLERELNIASSVAEQLASQVEQAKLQVNKDTPVFTVIEPVTVPYERDAPKRSLIVIGLTFLGFFLSAAYLVVKNPISAFWSSLNTENVE